MAFGGFFGGGGSSSNNNDDSSSSTVPSTENIVLPSTFSSTPSSTTEKVKQALAAQSNLANARNLIQRINNNCFEHCVQDPGSSLSGKEQACLSACMEKYIEGWNVVSKTYVDRLQKEQATLGAGMGGLGGAAGGLGGL